MPGASRSAFDGLARLLSPQRAPVPIPPAPAAPDPAQEPAAGTLTCQAVSHAVAVLSAHLNHEPAPAPAAAPAAVERILVIMAASALAAALTPDGARATCRRSG